MNKFNELAQMVPGGSSALKAILSNPQLLDMASKAGISLQDPKHLNNLLADVQAKVKAATQKAAQGGKPGSVLLQDGPKKYRDVALAHYRQVAAMM